MNLKKALIILLVLCLVVLEGYFITSLIFQKINQDKDVQSFCAQKCNYNNGSSYWEFSGEYSTKGFTTKDECFNHCFNVKMGFTYIIKDYGDAFLSFIGNIFIKK